MESPLRVLLVEDHADIRRAFGLAIELAGFDIREAPTGADALVALQSPIDVVLLDRDLPDGSGLSLIPRIRAAHPRAHVIIVSAAATEDQRVEGLLAGADDYVVKPASVREVVARLTACARHLRRERGDPMTFGPLTVNPALRVVLLRGEPVPLTRREFDLLEHLVRNAGRAVDRDELLAAAWDSSSAWQSTATVTEHVRRVRLKIEDDPGHPAWITSVRSVGYRFNPHAGETATHPVPARVVIDGVRIVDATESAVTLVHGSRPEDLIGRSAVDFIAPRSIAATRARVAAREQGGTPRPEIITLRALDGEELHVEISSTPVQWEDVEASEVTLWPITGRTGRLRHLVTGVATEVADAVIITNADRRIESFNAGAEDLYGWREHEVVGRTFDDVVPWTAGDRARANEELRADGRWHGRVSQRRRDGSEVVVSVSATILRDDAGTLVGVIAVNRPVAEGDPDPKDALPDAALADDIERGLDAGEFEVFYQPVVHLSTADVVGYEALVRWRHPVSGLLPPSAFIDMAEQSGSIARLGDHVLRTACEQARDWRASGADVYVAVNISARQLAEPALGARVRDAMERNALPSGVLWLEVTETALVEDIAAATAALVELRSFGARIAIDDFGTGWASLTYLQHFPIDALKIDRVFVSGLGERASDTAIVRSIVALANELDIGVVAEGIETDEQQREIKAIGVALAQGFLFGRPVPAADVAPVIITERASSPR
jgi:PAS domain S-box-containing protein